MWSELSKKEQEIVVAIADSEMGTVNKVREKLGMSSNQFTVYRDRLKKKGIIDTRSYGKVSLVLPRFDIYAKYMMGVLL